MLKPILTLAFLALSTAASAQLYVAGAVSNQRLRYDVDRLVAAKLDEGDNRRYLAALRSLGGHDAITTDLVSRSRKATVGYALTPGTAVELSYREYGRSTVAAHASLAYELAATGTTRGHTAAVRLSVSADGGGLGAVDATGVGLSLVRRVGGPFFARAGVERVRATLTTSEYERQAYRYSVQVDDQLVQGEGTASRTRQKVDHREVVAPLLGVGWDHPLTPRTTVRLEYERVGTLKEGFDFVSLGLRYRF